MSKVVVLKDERKKKNIKNLIMKIIFGATFLYIIYAIFLIARTPTDTIKIETGMITDEETVTGVIIRDEAIVKGKNYKNGIYQILGEGEKAAKNQTIFRYYGTGEEELQEKINETNLKLQEALEKEEKSIFLVDVKNLESQIDEINKNLNSETDIQSILEYKKNISNIMLKKATIIGENSQSGSYIKKLILEREKYEEKLEKDSEYIKAPRSGIVSYRVDGLEEVLGINNLQNLTSEELENLQIKTGKIISTNNEEGKIVNNFECYIATLLNSNTALEAEVGDKVKISLPSGEEINAEISNINDEGKQKLIIFKLYNVNNELIQYRKISFNITWWSYSGMKVPNESIIEEDNGLKYVIKKTTTGERKILVKILKKNERYSVIGTYSAEDLKGLGIDSSTYEGISLYDTIMMYPE